MGRILIRGEQGHDIIPELTPLPGEPIIDKPGKGAFYATDLGLILQTRGIKSLIICGVTTEVCVQTTAREANDRGYELVIPEDCCASYFPEFHRAALDMMKAQSHRRLGQRFSQHYRRAAKLIFRQLVITPFRHICGGGLLLPEDRK